MSFFYPILIETAISPINGRIQIELYQNFYRVRVKKYIQSGKYAENTIKTALSKIKYSSSRKIKQILILGLGCGSMAKVISQFYSEAQILGVDLDPAMIKIGKKYFQMQNIKKLKIKIFDAYEFLAKNKRKYDLIISDIFIGCDTPKKIETLRFIDLIYCTLGSNGVYISNRSYLPQYRSSTNLFYNNLKSRFRSIEYIKKNPNFIILAYK